MKRLIMLFVLFVLSCQVLFAEYKEDMAAGNAAYKKGELEQALKFYEQALEEQPGDQLFAFADKLRKKIEEKKQKEKPTAIGSDRTALIVTDIALSGLAVASYIDYSASGTAYENLYTAINNTTPSNYRILLNEKTQVESRGTFMAVAAGVAGAAVLYTLADMFIFNSGSSQTLKAEINPNREYAGLNIKWRF